MANIEISSTNIAESEPLATALAAEYIRQFCNFCFSSLSPSTTKRCASCKFLYYCSVDCQKADWREHKPECKLLTEKLDEWLRLASGPADLAFSATALLVVRLLVKLETRSLSPDTAKGAYSGKTFQNLLMHLQDLTKCEDEKMHHLTSVQSVTIKKRVEVLYNKKRVADEIFLAILTKVKINSHSILAWIGAEARSGVPTIIGSSIYLDFAGYDHSCWPNIEGFNYGNKMLAIPLPWSTVDAHDVKQARINYIDLASTRGSRRGDLSRHWYFRCECERCMDPSGIDLALSAILCSKCSSTVPVDDSTFRHCDDARFHELTERTRATIAKLSPERIDLLKVLLPKEFINYKYYSPEYKRLLLICANCETRQPLEWFEYALCLMSTISIVLKSDDAQSDYTFLNELHRECERILPVSNIFYARLNRSTAYCPSDDPDERWERMVKWYNAMRPCYPAGHSGLFQYAIPTCHTLLAGGMFEKAATILSELEEAARRFFLLGSKSSDFSKACPFADRLQYFHRCIDARQRACEMSTYDSSNT